MLGNNAKKIRAKKEYDGAIDNIRNLSGRWRNSNTTLTKYAIQRVEGEINSEKYKEVEANARESVSCMFKDLNGYYSLGSQCIEMLPRKSRRKSLEELEKARGGMYSDLRHFLDNIDKISSAKSIEDFFDID